MFLMNPIMHHRQINTYRTNTGTKGKGMNNPDMTDSDKASLELRMKKAALSGSQRLSGYGIVADGVEAEVESAWSRLQAAVTTYASKQKGPIVLKIEQEMVRIKRIASMHLHYALLAGLLLNEGIVVKTSAFQLDYLDAAGAEERNQIYRRFSDPLDKCCGDGRDASLRLLLVVGSSTNFQDAGNAIVRARNVHEREGAWMG